MKNMCVCVFMCVYVCFVVCSPATQVTQGPSARICVDTSDTVLQCPTSVDSTCLHDRCCFLSVHIFEVHVATKQEESRLGDQNSIRPRDH